MNDSPAKRGMLWIDAVGGFLMCFEPTVLVGQSIPGSPVDIPILGDLSSRHATLHRMGESYVVEFHAKGTIRGRKCGAMADLRDGDELILGDRVRLRFRQPHALSTTARLDLASPHRTQPSVDGILLMGNSCLLGPDPRMHVVCRHWTETITLSRDDAGVFRYRAMRRAEIDGTTAAASGILPWNSRLSGNDFALTIERQ